MLSKNEEKKKTKFPVVIPVCIATIAFVMSSPLAKEFSTTSDLLTDVEDRSFKSIFSKPINVITEDLGSGKVIQKRVLPLGQDVPDDSSVKNVSHITGAVPFQLTFNGQKLTSPADIMNYSWNFGDGDTAEGPVVSHTFQYPGIYAVTMKAKEKHGPVQKKHFTVTVKSKESKPTKTNINRSRTINISKSIEILPSHRNTDDPTLMIQGRPESG